MSHRTWKMTMTLLAAAGLLALAAPPAGAGAAAPVEVVKDVEGPAPENPAFEVQIACGNLEGEPPAQTHDFQFEGSGTDNYMFGSWGYCVVSEPVDGGASTVDFSCEATGSFVCESDTEFALDGTGSITITVTNTFAATTTTTADTTTTTTTGPTSTAGESSTTTSPAPVVDLQPAFTG